MATPDLPNHRAGFTLIELLVAMMIFAVLGTVAYRGLFQIQNLRTGVQAQSEKLASLQRAFYWIAEDLSLIADRPVRTTLGSTNSALEVGEGGDTLIEFTRSGWANPAGDILPPRSSLQRVAYVLDGDRLLRQYWYHLDRSSDDTSKRRLLLRNVDDFGLRYLDREGEWHPSWPPANATDEFDEMPAAMEVEVDIVDFGKIIRLFALPS